MSATFTKNLYEHCSAGIPVYYILTEDEKATIDDIRQVAVDYMDNDIIALEKSKQIKMWTVLDSDAVMCLDELKEETFLLMINPHLKVIQSPDFIQTIKNNTAQWRAQRIKVFLICNDSNIPIELNRDLVYMEYNLPEEDTIAKELQTIVESVEGQLKLEYNEKEMIQAALGLTSTQAGDAFSLSLVKTKSLDPKVVIQYKASEYLKTGIMELESPIPIESFKGYEGLKEYIEEIKNSFFTESKFNLPSPKGILLVGVPGTGKTLASRAIASELNLMLLKVDLGKVFSSYVGSSEKNIRTLIQIAERMSPVVLRIDEIEKQMSGMGSGGQNDSGVTDRVFAPLLSWMQDRTSKTFVIATANDITRLRPELLRKGRFDEIFFLDLPNQNDLYDITDYHLNSRLKLVDGMSIHESEINQITDNLNGYSGAEIEQICIQGLRVWENNNDTLDINSLVQYVNSEISKTTPLSIIRKDDIESLQNWAVSVNARLASPNDKINKKKEEIKQGRNIDIK